MQGSKADVEKAKKLVIENHSKREKKMIREFDEKMQENLRRFNTEV